MNFGMLVVAVILSVLDVARGAANPTEVFGGNVKIEYMHNVTSSANISTLFTNDNSTVFTSSAPLPPPDGIWGELIPFSPIDGCGPLELSNYTKKVGNRIQFSPVGPYPHVVALVARGNCSFEDKFDNVDDVPNVIGLVMYDYKDGGNLSNHIELSSFKFLNIPGFLIEHEPGVELKRKVDQMRMEDRKSASDPLWVKVTLKYNPHVGSIQNILQYALLLVMVLLCGAFLVSVYMHYHIYRMQRRIDENRQAEARNAITINESFLEKLPVRRFRRVKSPVSVDLNDGAGVSKVIRSSPTSIAPVEDEDEHLIHAVAPPNETCPICLDEFGQYESLNELPCGHFYHISCIRPWLQHRSPCCPMCKEDVRDAFITLPPLEEEKSFVRLVWESTRNFLIKWLCCGVCRKGTGSERPLNGPSSTQLQRTQMSEVQIMTPTGEEGRQRVETSSLQHVPLGADHQFEPKKESYNASANSL